jgi:hypothetical protein
MFALPASDVRSSRRRAWLVGLLSIAASGTLAVATWRPTPSAPEHRPNRVFLPHGDGERPRCPHAARAHAAPRPLALLLVQTHSAELDLAHYLDADRPGGFAARVMPFDRVHTPNIAITGDDQAWHWVGVEMDRTAALALAYRLRALPAIASARVVRVE